MKIKKTKKKPFTEKEHKLRNLLMGKTENTTTIGITFPSNPIEKSIFFNTKSQTTYVAYYDANSNQTIWIKA